MLGLLAISTKDIIYGLVVLVFLVVINLIIKYFIKPMIEIQYYKRQGGVALFCWHLIPHLRSQRDGSKKGDPFFTYKQALKKKPDSKFIVENFASKPHIVIVDLEMAKEMLKKYEIYQKDKQFIQLLLEVTIGTTIFAEGAVWKKGRRIITTAFNFEFLKDVVPMIVETTQERFREWIRKGDLSNIYLVEKLGEITGEVTGRFFFGKKFSEHKINGQSMTTVAQNLGIDVVMENLSLTYLLFGKRFIKWNILPRHKQLNRIIAESREKCIQMIEETEKNPNEETNLLKYLLELRKNGKEEDRLTDEQVAGEFAGLFGAGTDTTSHLINSVFYFLKKHPDVLAKVQEEVDREFKDLSNLSLDNLNKMEYTTAMLKETLRLGSPSMALFTRVAMEDDEICGVKIKKGTLLNIYPGLLFTSEKYHSRPDEFIPERWLGDSSFAKDGFKSEPYSFIPFSAGPRNCVGQHLATIVAKVIVAIFLKTFKFSFSDDFQFKLVPRFVFEPADPLLVTLELIKN